MATLKKRLSGFIILAIALSQFILPQAAFASFPDVTTSYPNYTAIIYLQENGVINGYSDGTFRPDNLVNRAEFLKIIIEGSGINTDVSTKTPFYDINNNAWYAPYVKKAYTSGWVQGYTDGTFRPEQTITKVEALKILGKVQNWAIPEIITTAPFSDTGKTEWFTPYVTFAKEKGLLEETGKLLFPNQEMSRAKISETVYRTIIKGLSSGITTPTKPPVTDTQTPPDTTTPAANTSTNLDFSPVTSGQISSSFYTNISLDSPIPNTFYKNEIYIFKGSITSGNYKQATVSIDDFTYTEPLTNNHFEIPIIFKEAGNFSLGMLPGDSGNTKIETISVLPTLPSSTNKDIVPSKLTPSIIFSNGKTSVLFANDASTIKRLTLSQGTKSVSYISRQSTDIISIIYRDFQNFSESSTSYSIESAKISSQSPLIISSGFSKSDAKTFNPTYHDFSYIDPEVNSNPPETMSSPSKISFTVTTNAAIEPDGYVTKPDGSAIPTTVSKNGNTYTYSYTPTSSGTYIVEVNNSEGIAVVNHPVYIGNKIPLLPDFFDKNDRKYFTGIVALNSMRTELLNDINKERKAQGLNEVVLADDLNNLAQLHSDDMVKNNYFSHMDLSGNMPEDRRKNLGIATPVAENLAKDVSIIYAHEGLMRSGTHRSNILDKDWTRVGLGIAKTTSDGGYLMITEEFSTEVVTQQDLVSMKQDLIVRINDERTTNGLNTFINDSNLDDASKYLNDKIINENTSLTNQIFSDTMDLFNITGQSTAFGRAYNLWSTIIDSLIIDEPALTTENWTNIGIDLQTDLSGIINVLVIINK